MATPLQKTDQAVQAAGNPPLEGALARHCISNPPLRGAEGLPSLQLHDDHQHRRARRIVQR
jgi:hypothetical protein